MYVHSHYRHQRTCDVIPPDVSQKVGHWSAITLCIYRSDSRRSIYNPVALTAPNGPNCHNRIRPSCSSCSSTCQEAQFTHCPPLLKHVCLGVALSRQTSHRPTLQSQTLWKVGCQMILKKIVFPPTNI